MQTEDIHIMARWGDVYRIVHNYHNQIMTVDACVGA